MAGGDGGRGTTEVVLRALYGFASDDELIEIGLKRATSHKSGWQSVFPTIGDLIGGGIDFISSASASGADAYIGACTIVGGPPARGRGNASVRGRASALWVDLDCVAPGRDGETYFADPETALGVLDSVLDRVGLPGAADVVVQSGWGVQGWVRLSEPVDARVASRWTRALISEIKNGPETGGKKQIDRVWDVTRVLRFPGGGTWNWRAGPEEWDAVPVTVWRAPMDGAPGIPLDKIIAALGPSDEAERIRFATTVPTGSWGVREGRNDRALLDMEAVFDEVPWEDILGPHGWQRVGGHGTLGQVGEMEVWLRPGKEPSAGGGSGLRSAVVYGDSPNILVVHSDSADTGLPGWWETRSRGGSEEGGSRRANTKWRTFVRLRARELGLLDYSGVGDEDAVEHDIRTQAIKIALRRVPDDELDWPSSIVEALRDDGDIATRWIGNYRDEASARAIKAAASMPWGDDE